MGKAKKKSIVKTIVAAIAKTKVKTYLSRASGLRIIFGSRKVKYDNKTGEKTKIPAIVVAFVNGRFQTEDDNIIKLMEGYLKDGKDKGKIINLKEEQEKISTLQKNIAENADNLSVDQLKAIDNIVTQSAKVKGNGTQGSVGA